jgi:RNA-directed DNA polymerase
LGRAVARYGSVSAARAVADALALAFLAGAWRQAELVRRGEQVLGGKPAWLAPLVRDVVDQYAVAPNDAYEHLSCTIRASRKFRRGLASGKPRARLVRLIVNEPSMGARRFPVPVLTTSADVADWLKLTPTELDWFADVRGLNAQPGPAKLRHYSFIWQRKKHGGYRLIEAPKARLKAIQQQVLHEILNAVPAHDAAHGFVKGRSVLTCAGQHASQAVLVRLDLEEFFPSVGATRVYRIFRGFGYPETVARLLGGVCTLRAPTNVINELPPPSFVERYDPADLEARARSRRRLAHRHLPQGAPTSPALANLACYRLDARLSGLAKSIDAT